MHSMSRQGNCVDNAAMERLLVFMWPFSQRFSIENKKLRIPRLNLKSKNYLGKI